MKKEIEPYTVLTDTREKLPWTFEQDERCNGTEISTLKTGDYTIRSLEHLVCFERKRSVSEFANNVNENRFFDEMERIKEYQYKFLVLEFNVDDILRFPIGSDIPKKIWPKLRVTPERMLSVVAKLQTLYGVNVIFAGDTSNAITLVKNIMYRLKILHG